MKSPAHPNSRGSGGLRLPWASRSQAHRSLHTRRRRTSRGFGVESGRFHAEGDQTFTVLERWAFLATKRTLEKVQEVGDAVGKHPATIYRWLEAYERSQRVSVFLRKHRTPAGSCAREISICASLGTVVL